MLKVLVACLNSALEKGGKMVIWDVVLSQRDRLVYEKSGYGRRMGFGRRPALLVIDVTYDFMGLTREPILESIKRFRNSCGEEGWTAVENLATLLKVVRQKGIPIIYSLVERRADGLDVGLIAEKNSRAREETSVEGHIGTQIVSQIEPLPGDIVIKKAMPSIFFGTPLLSYLNAMGVDSVLVSGCTTSGCVRASVVDAFSYNLKVAVVEECTFDRFETSHLVNLFDMNAKYADVVSISQVLAYLNELMPSATVPMTVSEVEGSQREASV